MASRRLFSAGLLIVVLLVSACDSPAPGPTATIPPTVAQPTVTLAEATPEVPGQVEMGFTEDGAPYRGDPNAPVTLLEFSDYQCPVCIRYELETNPLIHEAYVVTGKVKHVFLQFPIDSLHPEARPASEAALCAAQQGAPAFWAMHEHLFKTAQEWQGGENLQEQFAEYAAELDLDVDAWVECFESGKVAAEVQAQQDLGASMGVGGTPAFFINDWFVSGYPRDGFTTFEQVIEKALRGEPAPPTPTPTPPPFDVNPERPGYTYGGDITLGSAQAPLMVLEFINFQSAENQEFYLTEWPDMLSKYVDPGQVRIVVKHFPAEGQEAATEAAQAAECAGLQGAFWNMHDLLFEQPEQWSQASDVTAVLQGYADELDLDVDAFSSCLEEGQTANKVQQDVLIAQRNNLEPAPQFVVFFGSQASIVPLEDLVGVLDQLLEQL